MITPQVNNIDLIDILKEPTEFKPETNLDDFELPKDDTIKANPDDFDIKEEPLQNIKEEVPSGKPRLSENEYAEQAEMTIALFDGLQTLTLPWLYQKSLFTKEERKKLKELSDKLKKDVVELTEEDIKLREKYHTYKELSDNVPYTEKEVELLKGPLAKVFSKYNVQLGPEFILFSALAYVSVPRYLPLFSKLENLDI